MAKKVIDIDIFSPKSIEDAIWELQRYKQWRIERGLLLLKEKVADFIQTQAQAGFDSSIADDYTENTPLEPRMSTVTVSTQQDNDITLVVATGGDAIFIEFGAGVHHNGASGYSPHPWGEEHGFLIGEYGKGKGANDKWALASDVWSYGTPATMPMYNAVQALKQAFPSLVKEVFG